MKLSKRSLLCERLERREVLSGDVTVSVVGGDLVIRGDSAANYFMVYQSGADWIVAGAYRTGVPNSQTLVNGQSTPRTFSGVTGGLDIETGAGADFIQLLSGDLQGSAVVDLGDDDDWAFIDHSAAALIEANGGGSPTSGTFTFQGDCSLFTGAGNDRVSILGQTVFRGDFNFSGGAGGDWIYQRTLDRLSVEENLNVDMGDGDDLYQLIFVDVDGNAAFLDPSSGTSETTSNDTLLRIHNTVVLGSLTVTGGTGTTRVELNYTTAQSITVSLGDDPDSCQALHTTSQTLNIDLGAGNDSGQANDLTGTFQRRVLLDTVTATTSVVVNTGTGDDSVYAAAVATPNLSVITGAGSDGVVVFGAAVTTASFDTGTQADVIGIYQVTAANLSVQTGSGNEGGGFYGVVVGSCTITGTLLLNTGDGLDNVLLGSVAAANANIDTGASSDGLIVLFCQITTATLNTNSAPDVVGVYDSLFNVLVVLLGDGVDDLWYGNLTTNIAASLQGQTNGGTLHRVGTNQVHGETVLNLTVVP
jgi:hypothetical protein